MPNNLALATEFNDEPDAGDIDKLCAALSKSELAKCEKRPIVIDGPNVAINKFPSLPLNFDCECLYLAVKHWAELGFQVIVVISEGKQLARKGIETLKYEFIEKIEKELLTPSAAQRGCVLRIPSRVIPRSDLEGEFFNERPHDDLFVLDVAKKLGGVVVSMDKYEKEQRQYPGVYDEVVKRRIRFKWITHRHGSASGRHIDFFANDHCYQLHDLLDVFTEPKLYFSPGVKAVPLFLPIPQPRKLQRLSGGLATAYAIGTPSAPENLHQSTKHSPSPHHDSNAHAHDASSSRAPEIDGKPVSNNTATMQERSACPGFSLSQERAFSVLREMIPAEKLSNADLEGIVRTYEHMCADLDSLFEVILRDCKIVD